MAKLPYYELTQGNLEKERPMEVVDYFEPARAALSGAQKYFEQKEALDASRIMSKARSDWSIKINEMQRDAGLDYEGFSDKVNQSLIDYENEIINSVPVSQRDKFQANYAGLKYDMLNKAGAYEAMASAEKVKLDFNDITNNYANAILSDPSQFDAGIEGIENMVDGLAVADSIKDALLKDGKNTLAVSQINSLTNVNPQMLLSRLQDGYYDSLINPKQKASAINQAISKIKSNESNAKRVAKEQSDRAFGEDMVKVMQGQYSEVDLVSLAPKYVNSPNDYNSLWSQFDRMKKEGALLRQTALKMQNGEINSDDKADRNSMDMLYAQQVRSLPDDSAENTFRNKKILADEYVQTSGYIPKDFSNDLRKKLNSSNYVDVAQAAESFYEIKQMDRNVQSDLKDYEKDRLYLIGAAINSGYNPVEIIKKVTIQPTEIELKNRKNSFSKLIKDGDVTGDLDVDDVAANAMFTDIYQKWYMQTGDRDLAQKMGEDYVNTNYSMNNIGTGVAGFFEWGYGDLDIKESGFSNPVIARGVPMFQGPMQMYGQGLKLSKEEKASVFARDLLHSVKKYLPDAEYKDIVISNTNKAFYNGKPVYLVSYKGAPIVMENGGLLYWYPNVSQYYQEVKEEENANSGQ